MVKAIRTTEKLMGVVDYKMNESKKKSREFSRSLFIVENVKEGDTITIEQRFF